MLQLTELTHPRTCALQREATTMRSLHTATGEEPTLATTTESLWAATKTQHSQKKKKFPATGPALCPAMLWVLVDLCSCPTSQLLLLLEAGLWPAEMGALVQFGSSGQGEQWPEVGGRERSDGETVIRTHLVYAKSQTQLSD